MNKLSEKRLLSVSAAVLHSVFGHVNTHGTDQVVYQVVVLAAADDPVVEGVAAEYPGADGLQLQGQGTLPDRGYSGVFRGEDAAERVETGEDQTAVELFIRPARGEQGALALLDAAVVFPGRLRAAPADQLPVIGQAWMALPKELFQPASVIVGIDALFHRA